MIDGNKINQFLEGSKKKKPDFLSATQEEWEDALDGYCETFSNAIDEETTTEEYWSLIYFSAVAFCKGMEFAKIQSGELKESNYPRY